MEFNKIDEVQWCECRAIARELLVKLKENDIEAFINENKRHYNDSIE